MKLFMFYIGGNAGKSNIEVHDIQFVVAEKPTDAWPALREAWFGDKDKIHIDGYAEITWVDGLMDLILLLVINLAIVAVTYILLMWEAIIHQI